MKKVISLSFLLFGIVQLLQAQSDDFIQIKTSKPLGIYSFLEAASHGSATSFTYQELIDNAYQNDSVFSDIVARYKNLKVEYNIKFESYPESRKPYVTTKDLIWQAVSKSDNLDEVNDRIVGILPHDVHVELLSIMKEVDPYYTEMVWSKVQTQIQRIEGQLASEKKTIKRLFLASAKFYGTEWDESVPFVIALYPIPLEKAMTTAIPKGNTLICAFLSENENDYKGLIGVIVHEMCHILYSAQSISFQEEIDKWFKESTNEYSKLTYNYSDEGLATAIGNGWSFKEINGKIDTNDWYFDVYIDGFARSIYDNVAEYLDNEKTIDKAFVDQAIVSFQNKFPNAIYDVETLMNSIVLFSSTEDEGEINEIFEGIMSNYNIRSAQFSSPFDATESQKYLHSENETKLYFVHEKHEEALAFIRSSYGDLSVEIDPNARGYYSFIDKKVNTPVIIFLSDSIAEYQKLHEMVKKDKLLKFDVWRNLD